MEKISENITYIEATKSITALREGFSNTPNQLQLANMKRLALKIFEPLRAALGNRPIRIASFFRSPALNGSIGGAVHSQHIANNGAAMDLDNDNMPAGPTNREIFFYIKDNLEFDQLIWEYGDDDQPDWVHVSFVEGKNRGQVLRCLVRHKYVEYK